MKKIGNNVPDDLTYGCLASLGLLGIIACTVNDTAVLIAMVVLVCVASLAFTGAILWYGLQEQKAEVKQTQIDPPSTQLKKASQEDHA